MWKIWLTPRRKLFSKQQFMTTGSWSQEQWSSGSLETSTWTCRHFVSTVLVRLVRCTMKSHEREHMLSTCYQSQHDYLQNAPFFPVVVACFRWCQQTPMRQGQPGLKNANMMNSEWQATSWWQLTVRKWCCHVVCNLHASAGEQLSYVSNFRLESRRVRQFRMHTMGAVRHSSVWLHISTLDVHVCIWAL